MSKIENLTTQAELLAWIEPLAERITQALRADLLANTQVLEAIHIQLADLIEAQVTFLENMQRRSGK